MPLTWPTQSIQTTREIPKVKAYVSDTKDLKQDPSYQETWDDMIIHFLAESLDVIQDTDWVILLGNTFAKQYDFISLMMSILRFFTGCSTPLAHCFGKIESHSQQCWA